MLEKQTELLQRTSPAKGIKPFVDVLNGNDAIKTPFWFMRQAGRYLPEYREIRKDAGSFMDLCFNPELATKVTLQPLHRYDMNAAILFSDILVVPHALGQKVSFKEGVGPILETLDINKINLEQFHNVLNPVYITVKQIKNSLSDNKALIGFAGAPWTVATYMIEQGTSREFINIRKMMYQQPEQLQKIIDILVDATTKYLLKQIESGADVIQLFDSWAGILPEDMFDRWVIKPTAKIVKEIKQIYPDIPIIGFPKGAGVLYPKYIKETGVTAVSLDHNLPLNWAKGNIQTLCPVQGSLDPMALLAGGDIMLDEAKKIFDIFGNEKFIFNLGHGIHKDTPPSHLEKLVEFIKEQ